MKKKAIFFDRDGIVNERIFDGYVKTIDEFVFEFHFFELFKLIKELGYMAVLVTNQQCINKGIITENKLIEIHNFMQEQLLKNTGCNFDEIYYCPDLADSNSKYRKPETGMFDAAIEKYNIDVKNSWTIGDAITDVMAGKKVQTQTILVGSFEKIAEADFIFQDIKNVVEFFKQFRTYT